MEVVHEKPQLSDILQDITDKIREMLTGQAPSDYSYRLMPIEKVNSDREIDISLEIALRFEMDRTLKQSVVPQTNGVIESLQAVFPPVVTYKENGTDETWISAVSIQYLLDSLESVAGPLQYFENEPGSCLLCYSKGMVLFMRHGLH